MPNPILVDFQQPSPGVDGSFSESKLCTAVLNRRLYPRVPIDKPHAPISASATCLPTAPRNTRPRLPLAIPASPTFTHSFVACETTTQTIALRRMKFESVTFRTHTRRPSVVYGLVYCCSYCRPWLAHNALSETTGRLQRYTSVEHYMHSLSSSRLLSSPLVSSRLLGC